MAFKKGLGLILACTLCTAAGQLLFKLGVSQNPLFIFLGLVVYGAGFLLMILGLKQLPLSVAYPVISLGFMFVTVFAIFFLGETLSWNKLVGVLAIIWGVATIGGAS